ncbi:MAG TPA: PIG-L deacetylase family protein [Tepidisphaeraceae bacterium]|jgi:LmbE family N-acetylglucosaminyl deacetylase|nr:PIG-L deacetylase family protein [Tepidisphaeraceae bacterium]
MKHLVKRVVVGTWRAIVPKGARNSLRLWLMLEMPDRAPRLIEEFGGGPVVVLAPHMDDEIIGPGGTVVRHVQAGAKISFIYMTDGMAGDSHLQDLQSRQHLARQRKDESRRAAEIVGVRDLAFLDGADGALADTPEMVGGLEKILIERKPGIIYAPAVTDHHRDHWATNRVLRKAMDRLPAPATRDLIIRGYEVWTPAPANRMVDISEVIEIKKRAIETFASQTRLVDYSRAILGLNQYRSMMHLFGRGFAEAFWEMTSDEYRAAFDRISLARAAE